MTIARDSSIIESLAYFKRVGSAIIAPATALGGPVAILRISGTDLNFLNDFLGPLPPPNSFSYRSIKSKKSAELLDKVLLLYFKAPHSFTGEDVLEIQCHGVNSLIDNIQSEILSLGAERAFPGEFSFRAVLNKKMSLQEAEGLQTALSTDGIGAGWASKLLSISPKNESAIAEKAKALIGLLRTARGRVEASIDFPEAAQEQAQEIRGAEAALLSVKQGLAQLLTSYYQFSKTAGEPRVAIVGAPNAGKSTLINSLIGAERSIVSDVAGTTRDVVEARLKLGSGRWIRLLDTAGLRKTSADTLYSVAGSNEIIEKKGIELGLEAAQTANAVIWVVNSNQGESEELLKVRSSLALKTSVFVLYSHGDSFPNIDIKAYNFKQIGFTDRREILGELDKMLNVGLEQEVKSDFDLVISRRQGQLLASSELEVDRALESLRGHCPIELCGEFLREAETLLCRVFAQGMGEAYIEEIFRQFCLGK